MIDPRKLVNIQIGILEKIEQKKHQKTEELIQCIVKKVLTKSIYHPNE